MFKRISVEIPGGLHIPILVSNELPDSAIEVLVDLIRRRYTRDFSDDLDWDD